MLKHEAIIAQFGIDTIENGASNMCVTTYSRPPTHLLRESNNEL